MDEMYDRYVSLRGQVAEFARFMRIDPEEKTDLELMTHVYETVLEMSLEIGDLKRQLSLARKPPA